MQSLHRVRGEQFQQFHQQWSTDLEEVSYLNAFPSPGARRESTLVDIVVLGVLSIVVSGGYVLSLVPPLRWIVSRHASLGGTEQLDMGQVFVTDPTFASN
jgi:hypothetical protein